jgi:predicted molibdopterin-dependent oxidoreductase YjgC
MNRQPKFQVSLCPACGGCPEVILDTMQQEVRIGEEGNLVTLNREAWNTLVEKIQSGELKKI